MFRIIHTADIHLDACFRAPGMPRGFGNRRRQSLRDVFLRIVRRAGEWPADALLIAGDLFELDRLSRDTVALLQSAFESIAHVPVLIAPGNHDPFVGDSPYATEKWSDNVHIFNAPQWQTMAVAEGQLAVHGFAFDGRDISSNPFGMLDVPEDGAVHIGVAHGSERSHQPPDKGSYAPFDAAEAAVPGLKYLALGHFHAALRVEGDFTAEIHYSGAPEGLSFHDTGRRTYLEVEVDQDQARVTAVPSSSVLYMDYTVDCSEFSTCQQVVEVLREYARQTPEPQIARVTLVGACRPALQSALGTLHDSVSMDFDFLSVQDRTQAWEDYEALARENTSLGAFIRRLNEEIADAPDEARRQLVERAREVGLAAYRGRDLPVHGLEKG